MTCQEVRRHLSPYLDSELDPTTTFRISEHLRVCATCRARFEGERAVDRALVEQWRVEPMPTAMWNAIRQKVLRPARPPRRWLQAMISLAAAACVLLVVWILRDLRGSPLEEAGRSIVREFTEETRGGMPFALEQKQPSGTQDMRTLALFPRLIMQVSEEAAQNHVVQFVRITRETDEQGIETVEVRLNCCGEPVILRAVRADRPGRVGEFAGAMAAVDHQSFEDEGIHVSARQVGEFLVLGVSRHPLDHMLSAMTVH